MGSRGSCINGVQTPIVPHYGPRGTPTARPDTQKHTLLITPRRAAILTLKDSRG